MQSAKLYSWENIETMAWFLRRCIIRRRKKCKINLEITRDLGDILTNCNGRLRVEPDYITEK